MLCAVLCCAQLLSRLQLCNPMDCSSPASSVHGIFQAIFQYWSGLPRSPPGDLPNPGIKPACPVTSALAGRFFTLHHLGSPL